MNKDNIVGIVILFIAVAVIAVWALVSSSSPKDIPEQQVNNEESVEFNGALRLVSISSEYNAGDLIPVDLELDSDSQSIVGADLLIKYDPELVGIADVDNIVEPESDFFVVYPADGQTKDGLIRFSLLTQKPQILSGKIATVYFTAKKTGEVNLDLIFEKGKTNDSNIALSGKGIDILASVNNAIFKIVNSNQ